jgi:hypothetical protein
VSFPLHGKRIDPELVRTLSLALFVLGVLADYHNLALALDDLALLAHGLDGRSYFHFCLLEMLLLFASPGDPSARQIVGRHLYRDFVAGENADKVHPELSGNVREDDVSVSDIHLEHRVGQGLNHRALEFDYIVFCQSD